MSSPFISICVPTYNRAKYLHVLFESIERQTFRNFEVVVTDNTRDDSVFEVVNKYKEKFSLRYSKNDTILEMGDNWNQGITKATGEWVKIMHDDDWFENEGSLQLFVDAITPDVNFIFSAFYNWFEENDSRHLEKISGFNMFLLRRSPLTLLKKNYIGHPSTIMVRRSVMQSFAAHLNWTVDIEFYIRMLYANKFRYIDKPLICLRMHTGQATKAYFRNPAVEIPENLYLAGRVPGIFKNYFSYDYFWRLLRNMNIHTVQVLKNYAPGEPPPELVSMLKFQSLFPSGLLKKGILSKLLMTTHYLFHFLIRINPKS
jgi:glycosyltransferase involved in cell wall biosynthesis